MARRAIASAKSLAAGGGVFGLAGKRRALETVKRKLAGLIEDIAEGLRASGLQGPLDDALEACRRQLEAEIAVASATTPTPRLHPNLAEIYRTHPVTVAFRAGSEAVL